MDWKNAIVEYERLMRLNEDIIRFLTIRISSVDEKSSPLMNNKSDRYKSEVVNTETTSPSNVEA